MSIATKTQCNCFQETLDSAKKVIKSMIPNGSTDLKVEWENYIYFLQGDYSPVNPKIRYSYRKPTKKGTKSKRMTIRTFSVAANYCPYCGRELAQKTEKQEVEHA
ncbi:hypothetical protein [Shewanella sp.]|uniref:hypothetical protein n=1 Tax=Shewanella sp. TaxID=50422 RepID=UPI003569366A